MTQTRPRTYGPSGLLAALVLLVAHAPTNADQLQVTIENLQPATGFFFTPVWLGFHDGGFDLFDSGSAASPALEAIAETGDAGPLDMLLAAATNGDGSARSSAVVTAPGGFPGAPVFDPGELVTQTVSVNDPGSNRYLTYASMVIPSNDAFIGNGSPLMYPVFNADGSFAGPLTIEIFGGNIYDAGTEVNSAMGAAFSALGGSDSDEGGVVGPHPGLDNFLGTDTAAGTTLAAALGSDTPLARIHIQAVPEPSAVVLALLGLATLLAQRRHVV